MSVPLTLVAAACALLLACAASAEPRGGLTFACKPDNDLYRAVARARRTKPARCDTAAQGVERAPANSAVLVLAEGYPEKVTELDAALFDAAARKGLRLYVEYPGWLPDRAVGAAKTARWERTVVASDVFGPSLQRLRLLALHDCHYVPTEAEGAPLVLARVAGFDTAVFGLPAHTVPLLFESRGGRTLVSTTALSRFGRARYAPAEAWRDVWRWILDWLEPGGKGHTLRWTPSVRPAYGRDGSLPTDAEERALRRAASWFARSRMLVHPKWAEAYDRQAASYPDRTGPAPSLSWPAGDGSLGVMEGFSSAIGADGAQPTRWWRRNDCNGEAAGALALAGAALDDRPLSAVGRRIGDWLYTKSILSQGDRADPANPAYGLIGWNDVRRYWGSMDGYGVYYADDDARSMLGMMAASSVLKTDVWTERLARCLLANLRLSGRYGFQPDRIDTAPLQQNGWRHYYDAETASPSPHYQSYMWACYLWAYRQSGYDRFLNQARTAIRMTMAAYPDGWFCADDSLSLEQARMLLCLAWLVRVDDTPEHRNWLRRVAGDLLAKQDACGAIAEEIAKPGHGAPPPPQSNEAYGTTETPLIQSNGDPASDLLYTVNFALLGLHEAAASTGDAFYRDSEDRLSRFLCRVQVKSQAHPELDGGWFRAFDFRRWEYWASNADAGWGAWSMESGWTNTWIASVLALRRMRTSLWEATAKCDIRTHVERLRKEMLP